MLQGRAYHRYFEGYSERKVWDSGKKRYRIEKYYSGDYYRIMLPEDERKTLKRKYLAAYVGALILFVSISVRRTGSNAAAAAAVSTLIVLLGLLWLLPSLAEFLRMKELLVMREYRERKNFLSLSMGLVCFFLLNTAVHFGCMMYLGTWGDPWEWFCLAAGLADAGIFFWIYRREGSVEYRRIPNNAKIPLDCYDITLREK